MNQTIELPVSIKTEDGNIYGDLILPKNAKAVILFAYGSGRGRFSPRNQYVANYLNQSGFGTLLIDLLTREEEEEDRMDSSLRFDIPLLANRLEAATEWLMQHRPVMQYKIGYFGASTGAAAALEVAPKYPGIVEAVVSRGGRPDLAYSSLAQVKAPVLLIVGGNDPQVLKLNQTALEKIGSREKRLEVIPGATHLFEEPGKLDAVSELSADWFLHHLVSAKIRRQGSGI